MKQPNLAKWPAQSLNVRTLMAFYHKALAPRCGATTRNGAPCVGLPVQPGGLCHNHGGATPGPALRHYCIREYSRRCRYKRSGATWNSILYLYCDDDGALHQVALPPDVRCVALTGMHAHIQTGTDLAWCMADLRDRRDTEALIALDAAYKIRWLPLFLDTLDDIRRPFGRRKYLHFGVKPSE